MDSRSRTVNLTTHPPFTARVCPFHTIDRRTTKSTPPYRVLSRGFRAFPGNGFLPPGTFRSCRLAECSIWRLSSSWARGWIKGAKRNGHHRTTVAAKLCASAHFGGFVELGGTSIPNC